MKALLALLLAAVPCLALAQSAPDDTLSGPPPAVTTPASPDAEPPPPAPKPPPVLTPAPPTPSWEKHDAATLLVVDKIDGKSVTFTVPVGGKQTFRTLSLDVRSCYARPATEAPDATAFLVIADNAAAGPSFSGWMLAAEPAASMLEHPIYDVRVLGCR